MSKLDDSFMYSGMTSASTEPKTPRQIQKEEKEKDYYKLKPAAEVVLALLKTEKEKLYDLRTLLIDANTSDEEVKIERIVRQRLEALITKLESKVENTLKLGAKK